LDRVIIVGGRLKRQPLSLTGGIFMLFIVVIS
jgi:hypothetical protein